MASPTGFEPVTRRLGYVAVSTTRDIDGAPSRIRTYSRRVRRPSTVLRPGHVGADEGIRNPAGIVGDDTSHPGTPASWLVWLDLHQLPSAYRAGAHLYVLHTINWSERCDSNTHGLAPKASGQPLSHSLNFGHADQTCAGLLRVAAGYLTI
jgi:hypothetical protein